MKRLMGFDTINAIIWNHFKSIVSLWLRTYFLNQHKPTHKTTRQSTQNWLQINIKFKQLGHENGLKINTNRYKSEGTQIGHKNPPEIGLESLQKSTRNWEIIPVRWADENQQLSWFFSMIKIL